MAGRRSAWARLYEDDAKVLREMYREARDQGAASSREARPYFRVLRMMCHHLEGLGYTQTAIAEALGVSREYVRQLIAKAKGWPATTSSRTGQCWWPPEAPAPRRCPEFIGMPKRLGSNPGHWPRVPIPDADVRRLRRLRKATASLNGAARADDPRRRQARQLAELMADLIRRNHLPEDIAKAAGVTRGAVERRLISYGLKDRGGRLSVRIVKGHGAWEKPPPAPTRISQKDVNDALQELWG